jgi:hypothetical protein
MAQRVQVPAWSDEWMSGDRYGEIVDEGDRAVSVRLDKSGRKVRFLKADVEYV